MLELRVGIVLDVEALPVETDNDEEGDELAIDGSI